jgi:methylated-DNA-[protein]-cysteine S-methyltransferase
MKNGLKDSDLERALRTPVDEEVAERAAERAAARAVDEGLADVAYATLDSPLGRLLVASTERGLVRVSFHTEQHDDVLNELVVRISPRVLEAPARLDEVRRELDEYFEGERTGFDLPLDWRLSRGFRAEVLHKLYENVPYGETATYAEMAADAGRPRAYRAAGSAMGSNPIPVVVPCHRVVASGGGLGGYGGGLDMKRFLLRLEGALED